MNLRLPILFALFVVSGFESRAATADYVGTTPCGLVPRVFLGIPSTSVCDKIQWQLSLSSNTYTLTATFGLQEESAPGFVNAGTTVKSSGKLEAQSGAHSAPAVDVIKLTDEKSQRSVSFVRVNDNLIHLLAEDKSLMIGNEFWSYTLNQKGAGRDR